MPFFPERMIPEAELKLYSTRRIVRRFFIRSRAWTSSSLSRREYPEEQEPDRGVDHESHERDVEQTFGPGHQCPLISAEPLTCTALARLAGLARYIL
jgi:hypothetical protein